MTTTKTKTPKLPKAEAAALEKLAAAEAVFQEAFKEWFFVGNNIHRWTEDLQKKWLASFGDELKNLWLDSYIAQLPHKVAPR